MSILSRTKQVLCYFISILIVVLTIIWGGSFIILPWQVNEQLKPLGLSLSDETSLSFNPFNLHFNVDDLALINQAKVKQFSLEHAHINMSWLDLVSQRIVIEMATVESLQLNVFRNNEQLMIAGIDLSDTASKAPVVNDDEPSKNENSLLIFKGWSLLIPNFSFSDITLNIDDLGQTQTVVLKKLSLDAVNASLESINAKMTLVAAINKASLDIKTDINTTLNSNAVISATVNNQLKLSGFSLEDWQYLMPLHDNKINQLSGLVDVSFEQKFTLEKNQWQLTQPKFQIALNQFNVVKPEMEILNELFAFELNEFVIMGHDKDLSHSTGIAKLVIDKTTILANQQSLAALSKLEVPEVNFSIDNKFMATADIDNITFKEIIFSKPNDVTNALYSSEELSINDISWQENHLAIDTINLGEFTSDVVLSAEKKIKNLVVITQPDVTNEDSNNVESVVSKEPKIENESEIITLSLNKFELTSPSQVSFTDESVTPIFKHQIMVKNIDVNTIDSRNKTLMSPFHATLSFDEHATTTIAGTIAPFNEKMNMTLDVQMSEFSLPPLSSYLRTILGFDFLSGQLDNKLNIVVKDDVMNGETVIDLRGFELTSGDDTTDLSTSSGGAMGLNSALNMLKDGQGNVSLEVPLSGKVDDPSFGLSSVLTLVAKKAIMSQAKSYLINTFVPYANVVSVVSIAGEYLLRLKMNDLIYNIDQIKLSTAQQPFINELAALLKDKPEQQVKMCPIATIKEQLLEGQPTKPEIEQLKALSKNRGSNLKKILIEKYKISSSRILLCAPKVDNSSTALPRIEFSF